MNEIRKLSTLKNWDKNPRSIKDKDFERLKTQIRDLGQYKPLLITEDGTVLGGNMRLRAYRELGIEDIWVSIVDAPTEDKKLEFALSDNDRAGFYDVDLLANLIPEYPDFEWDQYAVDLKEPQNLQQLIDSFKEVEEDEVPEVAEGEPESKLGEVYQLGRHRLMCGDATKIEDVEKLMDGHKADMVFTDPPYGMEYKGEVFGKKGIQNDGQEWQQVLSDALTILPIENGVVAICFAPTRLKEFFKTVDSLDFHRRLTIYKPNRMAHPWHGWIMTSEDIYLFSKGDAVWIEENHKHDVYTHDYSERPDREIDHPTVKPLSIVTDVIKKTSNEESIIYDAFGGSGSTLIACEQTNRICYMCELDPKYVDVIRTRYQNYVANKEKQ